MTATLAPDFREAAAYKHYFAGEQLREGGDYVGAIHEYIKSTQVSQDLSMVWNNMGSAYAWLEQHADAETCYRGAVNLRPNNLTYCANLAMIIDNLDEAIQLCKHALSFYDPGIHASNEAAYANHALYTNLYAKAEANEMDSTLLEEAHSALRKLEALAVFGDEDEDEECDFIDEEDLEELVEWFETLESNDYKLTLKQKMDQKLGDIREKWE